MKINLEKITLYNTISNNISTTNLSINIAYKKYILSDSSGFLIAEGREEELIKRLKEVNGLEIEIDTSTLLWDRNKLSHDYNIMLFLFVVSYI